MNPSFVCGPTHWLRLRTSVLSTVPPSTGHRQKVGDLVFIQCQFTLPRGEDRVPFLY